MTTIDAPWVGDMTDADYFANPAFSHSDAKLLTNTTPAKFRWIKDNHHRDNKPEFDFGHAVHELVLGEGAGIDIIDADNWKKKADQEARKESWAAGRAPLLTREYEEAKACAAAVTEHPTAAKLLANRTHTEQAMFWPDGNLTLKAKLDLVAGPVGADLKTTDDASTDKFGRSAANFGYATQDAWYREAMRQCLGIDDPLFVFIVVEKSPPYLVNCIQLDPYDVELGARANRLAIEQYRTCVETGNWPGHGDGVNEASLPRWWEIEHETN